MFATFEARGPARGACSLLLAAFAAAAQAGPQLRYDPPPGFYRSAITPPDDYSSNEFNAVVQIYPFRPASGSLEQAFRQGLLRDWIDPRYQETNVAGPPEFRPLNIRGARMAISARFAENVAGIARQRMRFLILADGSAAIVDASANNLATWQRALPALNAMAASLRVEAGAAGPPKMTPVPDREGHAVAGLYMGTKPKYVVDLNRPVGYGRHVVALHYYLFSADGRVYRAYDDIHIPAGGIGHFDFEAARRADPVNSGRYTVRGDQLHIQMGDGQPAEVIATARPRGGRLTLDSVVYVKQ